MIKCKNDIATMQHYLISLYIVAQICFKQSQSSYSIHVALWENSVTQLTL